LPSLARHAVHVFGERGLAPEGVVRDDTLASEVPVALVFNGVSHAVMMATPQDLEAFALGFALSEGILDSAADCRGIEVQVVDASDAGLPEGMPGIEVRLEISTRSFERLKDRRRSLAGRTGCGVCGVESFAGLDLTPQRVPPRDWIERIDLATVLRAFAAMPPRQVLNAEAGAIHAAGWATVDGELTDVMEDVGRHNALDKLLGKLAAAGPAAGAGLRADVQPRQPRAGAQVRAPRRRGDGDHLGAHRDGCAHGRAQRPALLGAVPRAARRALCGRTGAAFKGAHRIGHSLDALIAQVACRHAAAALPGLEVPLLRTSRNAGRSAAPSVRRRAAPAHRRVRPLPASAATVSLPCISLSRPSLSCQRFTVRRRDRRSRAAGRRAAPRPWPLTSMHGAARMLRHQRQSAARSGRCAMLSPST
jgi:FdhD protein